MSKVVRGLLTLALCLATFTSAMHAADSFLGAGTSVFVMTNGNTKNEVLAYQRTFDGKLAFRGRFATGGRGSGGTTDPLQSQGSLVLSQDHQLLLAVNTASGTVSSFHLLGGLPVLV